MPPVLQDTYTEVSAPWTLGQITRDDDDVRTNSYRTDPAAGASEIGFAEPVRRKAGSETTTVQKGLAHVDTWAAGVFAIGALAAYDGEVYRCKVVRGAGNADNPATDDASWNRVSRYGIMGGITIRDRTLDPERASSMPGENPVTFGRGQMISVLEHGCVAVKVGAGVKGGDSVYFDTGTNKFYSAKGANRVLFADAQFLSVAAAEGIAELRLDSLRYNRAVNSDGP